MVLSVHLYSTSIKFGDEKPVFLHGPALKYFHTMLEGLEIPLQLHGFFDYKHFKNGKLLIELHDHRLGMDQAPETLTLHMSPSQVCLYQDFLTLVQQLKKDGSDKTLHEVEARYLLATQPHLDLHVHEGPMLLKKKNMDQFNLKKYQCRRITTSTSTWEKREENIKALEEEKRLLFMDEKRHGTTRFHPTFSRLDFIHDWRQRKLDASKIPSQYFLDRRIQITDGRILIRTIKFRRNVNEKIFYSILNVFSRPPLHNDYEAELRWGTIPDTSYEGEKMRFYLGPEIVAAHLLNSFLRLYVIENTLCFDAPARTEPIAEPPQSPAPVPSPLDVPPLQTHAPPATSPVPSILPLPTAPTSSSSLSPALPPPNPTLPFNVQTPKMTAKEITPPLVPPDKIKPPPKSRKLKKASTTHTLPSSSGMKKALELEKEKFHELEPEPKPEPETEPKTELELEPTKPAVLEKKKKRARRTMQDKKPKPNKKIKTEMATSTTTNTHTTTTTVTPTGTNLVEPTVPSVMSQPPLLPTSTPMNPSLAMPQVGLYPQQIQAFMIAAALQQQQQQQQQKQQQQQHQHQHQHQQQQQHYHHHHHQQQQQQQLQQQQLQHQQKQLQQLQQLHLQQQQHQQQQQQQQHPYHQHPHPHAHPHSHPQQSSPQPTSLQHHHEQQHPALQHPQQLHAYQQIHSFQQQPHHHPSTTPSFPTPQPSTTSNVGHPSSTPHPQQHLLHLHLQQQQQQQQQQLSRPNTFINTYPPSSNTPTPTPTPNTYAPPPPPTSNATPPTSSTTPMTSSRPNVLGYVPPPSQPTSNVPLPMPPYPNTYPFSHMYLSHLYSTHPSTTPPPPPPPPSSSTSTSSSSSRPH